MEKNPRKYLFRLAQKTVVFASSASPQHNCYIYPYIRYLWLMNSKKQFINQNWIMRTGAFVQCTLEKYPILVLFSLEAWFRLHGRVKSQNNSFSMSIQEVPFHDVSDGVLCVTSITKIICNFFTRAVNAQKRIAF
jgi:hypothetical protein